MDKMGYDLEDHAEVVPVIADEAGGRLMIRLNVTCSLGCRFCTIADIAHLEERGTNDAVAEMDKGRQEGCTELVFMRGEPTMRKDLPALIAYARQVGYRTIQVQTNGRMFFYRRYLTKLLRAGATFFEVSLFGPTAAINDAMTRVNGSFEQTETGLKNLVVEGVAHMVTVPVVAANVEHLTATVELLAKIGVPHVQLNFSRPVMLDGEWNTKPLVRLNEAAPHIRSALARARELGMVAGTEAVPLCHLAADEVEAQGMGGDMSSDFGSFRVADLHRHTDSMAEHRKSSRPEAPECEGCKHQAYCPRTWSAYQEIYGTEEFSRVDDGSEE